MPVIFVSYRRTDSQDVTGRIYDRLVGKFSPRQVFKDVDNIPLGVSFPMHIRQVLSKANIVIVIIGPTFTTTTNAEGVRRLDDENDFVRLEVESALKANIPVIPVLVSNARMPTPSELPPSMRKLVERNGINVRPDPDFNNDMARLFSGIDHLDRLLNPVVKLTKKHLAPITVVPIEPEIRIEVVKTPPRRVKKRVAPREEEEDDDDELETPEYEELHRRVPAFAVGGGFSAFAVVLCVVVLMSIMTRSSMQAWELAAAIVVAGLFAAIPGMLFGLPCGTLPWWLRNPLSLALLWALVIAGVVTPFAWPPRPVEGFVIALGWAAAIGGAYGLLTGLLAMVLRLGIRGFVILAIATIVLVGVAVGVVAGAQYWRAPEQRKQFVPAPIPEQRDLFVPEAINK